VTVKNLEIVQVHPEINELYIKGAVPGGRNALLMISGEGELKLKKTGQPEMAEQPPETKQEAPANAA